MAASASTQTLQSYMTTLTPRLPSTMTSTPYSAVVSLPSRRNMRIRCQTGDQPKPPPTSTPTPPPQSAIPPPPPPPKRESTSFSDVLAFSGPAPERINGRLAMVGFVSAVAVEAARGIGLFDQIADGGLNWFVVSAGLLTAASLVPLFKGVSVQSKSEGVMTADAELWNGRFAMLGLVALAFTEYVTGGPLV